MPDLQIVPADKVARIVGVYTHVQWPLSIESVDEVADALGWTRIADPRRINVVPDFQVSHPNTTFLNEDGVVKLIECWVCDAYRGEDPQPLKAAYQSVRAAVVSVLGKPGSSRSGDSWWDLETGGRIHVIGRGIVMKLQLLSKEYADIERGEVRYGISPDRVLGQDE